MIVEVTKFISHDGIRYNKTNFITGDFINEGSGFYDNGNNHLQ